MLCTLYLKLMLQILCESSWFVGVCVTFELNALLDLSWKAMTKLLCSLQPKLLLQILSESTWIMVVWMICGDEGVGDIPGVRGGSGGL